jgi:hypothetical protein
MFNILLGRVCRLASQQVVGYELGIALDMFHAIFGLYGRRARLAVALQALSTQRRFSSTFMLLQWKHLDCCSHSYALLALA